MAAAVVVVLGRVVPLEDNVCSLRLRSENLEALACSRAIVLPEVFWLATLLAEVRIVLFVAPALVELDLPLKALLVLLIELKLLVREEVPAFLTYTTLLL